MATKPKTTLLKESLDALKAVQKLRIDFDHEDDLPMHRAFQRVDRVLAKAAKAA
jgi:hypothetical protein